VSNQDLVYLQGGRRHSCVLVGVFRQRSLQKSGIRLPIRRRTSQVVDSFPMLLALCDD